MGGKSPHWVYQACDYDYLTPQGGVPCSKSYKLNWRASEASETLSGVTQLKIGAIGLYIGGGGGGGEHPSDTVTNACFELFWVHLTI